MLLDRERGGDGHLHAVITRMARRNAVASRWGWQLADDLAQEAWCHVLTRRSQGKRSDIDTDIGHARWAMWNYFRSLKTRQRFDDISPLRKSQTIDNEPGLLRAIDLQDALDALGEKGWRVRRNLFDGLTHREIAEEEGVTGPAVSMAIGAAIKTFYERFETSPPAEPIGSFHKAPCPKGHTLHMRMRSGLREAYCVMCRRARDASRKARAAEAVCP